MVPSSSRFYRLLRASAALVLVVGLSACASTRTWVDEPFASWEDATPSTADPTFRVFLLGNTADAAGEHEAVLRALEAQLDAAGENSAVVLLGDQLRRPLADSLSADRAASERALIRLADALDGYAGRVVVLPGDRDWSDADALEDQADWFSALLGADVLVPPGGLPGPVDLRLSDDLVLIALDTEWWLRDASDRPTGEVGGEDVESELDVIVALTEMLAEYDDDRIIVAGHHPVFSNGERGGHYTLRQHLFPLTDLWEPLYLPLPVVGSAYPLLRSYFGGRQDFSNGDYRELRAALPAVFEKHDGVIYASAHEAGLQYFPVRIDALALQHYVVSGGGAEGALARGFGAGFVHGGTGFASLQIYEDDTLWLEFWEPGGDAAARLAFRTPLEDARREAVDGEIPVIAADALPDYTDSTRVAVADPRFEAGSVKEFFFGDNYRDVWAAPVGIRVLDLGSERGGLRPLKRGGGYQTVSLRVANPEGREFVLRQVRKRPGLLLPPTLQRTFAADVLADQFTSMNPYAALAVPPLAEAAGIYHTNPEFRVVPDDPRLGVYREDFSGTLVLFEERPAGDATDQPYFGGAEDIDSSAKMFSELREDNDTRVDQPFFLRNRLFDLLIGDWDRHEDQWRWAQFEPFQLDSTLEGEAREQGKVYRPIPRDRDQAFFRLTGLFPRIAQLFVRGLQDFDPDYGDVIGLTDNGLFQDRRLLNDLSRPAWQAVAADLQRRMTDDVFRDAIAAMPDTVVALHGDRIFGTLQSRRDKLPEVADEFYELLADVVDVVGSDKHERFAVERREDGTTAVTVFKTNKEGENRKAIYERVFLPDETKEIRLYGLGGRDRFEITGAGRGGPYVRAIGGPGEDTFEDDAAGGTRAHFYDTERGNEVERGDARLTLSDDPAVNRYDPEDFAYPVRPVFPVVGYSPTEGVSFGATVEFITPKFRKEPYGRSHLLAASVTTRGGVRGAYRGRWVERFGPFDALVEASGTTPQSVRNFYGLGNETDDDRDDEFFRIEQATASLAVGIGTGSESGVEVGLAPALDFSKVYRGDGILASLPAEAEVLDAQVFAGGDGLVVLHHEDRVINPRQGFRWENRAGIRTGVQGSGDTFGTLSSALAVYLSPSLDPQLTLALRVGAEHVAGDFPFYRAATLGGATNLRGYRSTRFSGRSAFYQNAEARVQLFRFRSYVAAGTFGLLGFVDNGRVWADGEDSSAWHQGVGGGLWVNLFDLVLLNGTVGVSEDGALVSVGLGFLY